MRERLCRCSFFFEGGVTSRGSREKEEKKGPEWKAGAEEKGREEEADKGKGKEEKKKEEKTGERRRD